MMKTKLLITMEATTDGKNCGDGKRTLCSHWHPGGCWLFQSPLETEGGKHKRTAECLAAEEAADESDRT